MTDRDAGTLEHLAREVETLFHRRNPLLREYSRLLADHRARVAEIVGVLGAMGVIGRPRVGSLKPRQRLRVIERDGYRCQRCGFTAELGEPTMSVLQAHHCIPRLYGGPDADWNLITLCAPCHGSEPEFTFLAVSHLLDYWSEVLAYAQRRRAI